MLVGFPLLLGGSKLAHHATVRRRSPACPVDHHSNIEAQPAPAAQHSEARPGQAAGGHPLSCKERNATGSQVAVPLGHHMCWVEDEAPRFREMPAVSRGGLPRSPGPMAQLAERHDGSATICRRSDVRAFAGSFQPADLLPELCKRRVHYFAISRRGRSGRE